MDTVFLQCGICSESNFDWNSLLGSICGAIVSGIIAFCIFKGGINSENKKQKEIENARISTVSDFIKTSLELIFDGITEQSKFLLKSACELKKRRFKGKTFKYTSRLRVDSIMSIPYLDIYKVFTLKKLKGYNEFQANIAFLNSYSNYFPVYINDFKTNYYDIQKKFNEDLLAFTNIYDSYISGNESSKNSAREEVTFFWSLKTIEWQQIDETSIDTSRTEPYIVYEKIIKPVINYIRKNKYEINVMDILHAATKCKYHIKNFDHQRNALRRVLILDALKLRKAKNQLNRIKDCL